MKKYIIIKMAPHFGTYHWSKKMLRSAKNTIQGAKMAFGTPFLAPCIGVALSPFGYIQVQVYKIGLYKRVFIIALYI